MHLPPYALANVRDTRRSFQAYLDENFITSLKEQIDKEGTHPIIREHYLEALMHYDKLCDDFDEDNKERQVLKDFFKLRMALHFQGSGGLEVDFHPLYWASQMFVENWVPFQHV
ncbi:hypothetical protein K4K57_007806 [Colletotrichum sp. SAR 10_99]|nr:hypothetical protein K4K55_000009 [Colletotrichum sp. SAR 10_96]KAJ5019901.1 hypothetical protein K4K57_007806 [Colletotrichum sp. SAR 10_99]